MSQPSSQSQPPTPSSSRQPDPISCTHCGVVLSRFTNGKLKLRVASRLLAFRDGVGEMPCPYCEHDTVLPVVLKPA